MDNHFALKSGHKVWVTGHTGMLGAAVLKLLENRGCFEVIVATHQELELTDPGAVADFYRQNQPDWVIHCAAKVGGIGANLSYPADLIGENLAIQNAVIWGAHHANIQNLCFIGSSCIYPKECPQPMKEESLLTGKLEPSNEAYAIAKIAGLHLCEAISKQYRRNYFTVLPCNIYGPGDNFDPDNSHVVAAMIRRFQLSSCEESVECWGSGNPVREFLYVDDAASAILFLCQQSPFGKGKINIGTGVPVTIRQLAMAVQKTVGHKGKIEWNTLKPDGYPAKVNDIEALNKLGWKPLVSLEEGLRLTFEWWQSHVGASG